MYSKMFIAVVNFIIFVSVIIDAQEMRGISLYGPFKFCKTNDIRTIWDVSAACAQTKPDELIPPSHKYYRLVENFAMVTNLKLCQMYKNLNVLFSKFDDEFINFYDARGNELVLYSSMSRVMVPPCMEIMEIYVIKETKNCYKDFPIQINVNDVIVDAFLTQEGIIRISSKIVHCKNYMINLRLKKTNLTLVKRGNKASIQREHEFLHYKINVNNVNITEFNYKHDLDIINSFNTLNASAKSTILNDGESNYHIMPDFYYEPKSSLAALEERISNLPVWLIDTWVYVGSFLCLFLVKAIFVKIVWFCVTSAMKPSVMIS